MDVATLVARLIPVLDDPIANSDEILGLLGRHCALADYEVVRFLVAKRTESLVHELLADPDPQKRRTAVRWVELTFPRSPAARILRAATRDRSRTVRRAAVHATRALRLDDVALPDRAEVRTPARPAREGINPFTQERMVFPAVPARLVHRGFNATGWRFGLYPTRQSRRASPALSALVSREDVEKFLGISPSELSRLLRPGAGPGCPYVAFVVPKASGGERTLHAPRPELKRLQGTVLRRLLAPLEPHPAAHGFVPGRSTVTNAQPHVGSQVVVKMDLVDFFPTIHFARLVGLFEQHGAGKQAAKTLAALVTYRPRLSDGRVAWPSVLPQGAPTSPALSNLLCRRLDARLTGLAEKSGAAYTRYADDLTFSFRERPSLDLGHFMWWVDQIIGQEGFVENTKKRRVLRPAGQIRITGLVANTRLGVPRDARRRFRAMLHNCESSGVTREATQHDEPRAYLMGFASYVAMVQPEHGARLLSEVRRLLARGW